jgi:membrane-bound lytic murein transglycosylase MltF
MTRDTKGLPLVAALLLAGCQPDPVDTPIATRPVEDVADSTAPASDVASPSTDPDGPPAQETAALPAEPLVEAEPDLLTDWRREPWRGDFQGMVERRVVRALVTYSRTHYFLDGAQPRGLSHEALTRFEDFINEKLGSGHLRVHVVAIPVTRDEIYPALLEGRGDLASANLMITPERAEEVDFSSPFFEDVSQLVVTGPGGPPLASLDDLSGKEIHLRLSSSYYDAIVALNERFIAAGRTPVAMIAADETLEDEDLLEMVDAGLIPAVVVDSHKAEFWAQIFPNLRIDPDLALRTDGQIAWAFRKESPELEAVVNEFVRGHRGGTLLGNMGLEFYLKDASYVRNALAAEDLVRFRMVAPYFREYSEQYDLDWRLLVAQGYQESHLDQSAVSSAGAVGVMQLLPETASGANIGIPQIDDLESNVHAGAKYLRFLLDRYFSDAEIDPLNRYLFAFAAYNAGPRRVALLRREAAQQDLDANLWFDNVERIAARRIGRETVEYVSNIFKYYVTYRRFTDLEKFAAPESAAL